MEQDMERSTELLEEAIEDGFAKLDEAKDSDDYCNKVKAVKDLYDLKTSEYKAQVEYWDKQEELEIKKKERTAENIKAEREAHWWNKVNPNTVITTGAMVVMSAVTILENHEGWIFKPDGFLAKLMNRDK